MFVKIYGYSDDTVVIDNDKNFDDVDCYDEKVTIWFSDQTVIEIEYHGIWKIKEIQGGFATRHLIPCEEETVDNYSDVFEINADIVDVCVGEVNELERDLVGKFREIKKEYPLQYISEAYKEVFGCK